MTVSLLPPQFVHFVWLTFFFLQVSSRYDFVSAGEGTFNVVALDKFTHVDESGNLVSIQATQSSPVSIVLTGNLAAQPAVPEPLKVVKRATFKSCTAQRQATIKNAWSSAHKLALNASNYLKRHRSGTRRYTTWFGKYTAARHRTVTNHFGVSVV